MSLLTIILASLAALEHLYIFIWRASEPHLITTSRVFNMDKEELCSPICDLFI